MERETPAPEPTGHAHGGQACRDRDQRPDVGLFHAHARCLPAFAAESVVDRLQDPARYRGVFVHFAVLTSLFEGLDLSFGRSQAAATIVAISSNFFLNNMLTYRDQRLEGRALLYGWISFNLVCATGAAANIGVADWLFERDHYWVISALAGIAVSVVWNYAMSSLFTWRKR